MKELLKLIERDANIDGSDFSNVFITVPNIVDKDVTLMFNGWNIKLHPNGKWTLKDTSK